MKIFLFLTAVVFTIMSCAANPKVTAVNAADKDRPSQAENSVSPLNFSDITGKDWILMEVRTGSTVISIERPSMSASSFTIKFDENRVSGVGAPNRYFSSYTKGEGNAISIGMVGATQMASLFELETLKEHEYFEYLSKVTSWNISDGKLELYTSNKNGVPSVLVYF